MNHSAPSSGSPLGKSTAYVNEYNPHLLFSIPRSEKRVELGITNSPPFFGMDVWTAYEISWLNLRGKPQVAIATFFVPADSPNIVESKSLKLYLNSLNQSRIAGPEALLELMSTDLSLRVNQFLSLEEQVLLAERLLKLFCRIILPRSLYLVVMSLSIAKCWNSLKISRYRVSLVM